jgi:hypothetical protein
MSTFKIHTDCLFDPKQKKFVDDVSLEMDTQTGLITEVIHRKEALSSQIVSPDIDLRGKVVCPGFVEAHSHIFLHAYELVVRLIKYEVLLINCAVRSPLSTKNEMRALRRGSFELSITAG